MNIMTWNDLQKEGYTSESKFDAALPMQVWRVDLEIDCRRAASAAELAVLKLLDVSCSDVPTLTRSLGMGSDDRLVERVLVKLLGVGAVEPLGSGFTRTDVGAMWLEDGNARARERVTAEIRLDPVRDRLEWVDYERPVFSTANTWTIELPSVDDEKLLRRRAEIGDLVRRDGLPDEEERAPTERREAVDLRGLAVLSRRIHYRSVRVEIMRHPTRNDRQFIGYIGDAENPPLSHMLSAHTANWKRRRLARRGTRRL